ncbi:MAG: hypothetical protein IT318_11000 [Anaerolineales bacterium]|nr:hypothetical protein [Anaerolineales bacterium]
MADLSFWLLAAGLALALDLASFWSARDSRRRAPAVDRLDELAGRLDDVHDRFLRRVAALWQSVWAAAPRLSQPETRAATGAANQVAPVPAAEPIVAPRAQAQQVITVPSEGDGSAAGLARVDVAVYVPAGTTVRVTVEASGSQRPIVTVVPAEASQAPAAIQSAAHGQIIDRPALPGQGKPGAGLGAHLRAAATAWRARPDALALTLFAGALAVYALTRLAGLDRYPIYFFTDEAAHTVLAADFLRAGFRNYSGELWPTYFSLGPSFGLNGVSVYLQVLPYLLLGKSVAVTRGVSALVTLIAAAAVSLTLRDIFKLRFWWTGALLLGLAPAWFLHSRTAFEYVELASFYAGFLYFYLRYRCIAPRNLYAALVFGALTFYTHGLGQVLMGVTGLLLAAADARYHWEQRATVRRGALLLAVLALPYLRYALAHADTFGAQLRVRESYWVTPGLSLAGKLRELGAEYVYGLSPAFWYLSPNGRDIARHVMNGYGNLWLPTLPLAIVGLLTALGRWRSPAYRIVLLTLLAAPVGSALVAIGVPRMLWAIIPLTLLTTIGLALPLDWLARRARIERPLAVGTFLLLAGINLLMLRDALINGPLWSGDYALEGMQYGAQQIFGEAVPEYLREHPQAEIMVSAVWANGADLFIPFFLDEAAASRVRMGSLDHFTYERRELAPDFLAVFTAGEFEALVHDPKFDNVQVERVLDYPDGSPGFYFVRFAYSAEADALFEAERLARQQPVVETFVLDGQVVTVTHPRFGAGALHHILDGDPFTLVNTPEVNPTALSFAFSAPRALTGLTLVTGSMADFTVTLRLFAPVVADPTVYTQRFLGLPPDPAVEFAIDQGPASVERLVIEIADNQAGPDANIHIREVTFH